MYLPSDQVGRAARDGSQGAAVVITTKGDTGHKELKKLFCKKGQGRQKEPGCLVDGLSKIFQLSNPDGIQFASLSLLLKLPLSSSYCLLTHSLIRDLREHSQDCYLRARLRHRAALSVQSVSVLQ